MAIPELIIIFYFPILLYIIIYISFYILFSSSSSTFSSFLLKILKLLILLRSDFFLISVKIPQQWILSFSSKISILPFNWILISDTNKPLTTIIGKFTLYFDLSYKTVISDLSSIVSWFFEKDNSDQKLNFPKIHKSFPTIK